MKPKSKFKQFIDRRAKHWMKKGKIKIAAYGKALAEARKKGLHPPKKNPIMKSTVTGLGGQATTLQDLGMQADAGDVVIATYRSFSKAQKAYRKLRSAGMQVVHLYNFKGEPWKVSVRPYNATEAINILRGKKNPKTSVSKYSKRAARFLKKKIPQLMREGYPQPRAVAAAMSEARRKGIRMPNHPVIGAVQGLAGAMSLLNPPTETQCPTCGGPAHEIGKLGSLTYYKCRNCGAEFSKHEAWRGRDLYSPFEDQPTFKMSVGAKSPKRNPALTPPSVATCPVCGGEAHPLGTLGKTTHFKCRQCGAEFPYHPVPESIDLGGGKTWHKDLSKIRRSRSNPLTPLAQTMHRAAIPAFVNPGHPSRTSVVSGFVGPRDDKERRYVSAFKRYLRTGEDQPNHRSITYGPLTEERSLQLSDYAVDSLGMGDNPSQRQIITSPLRNPLPTPLAQTMHRAAIPAFRNPSMQSIIRTPMQNPKRHSVPTAKMTEVMKDILREMGEPTNIGYVLEVIDNMADAQTLREAAAGDVSAVLRLRHQYGLRDFNPKRNCYGMKTKSGSMRSGRYGRTSSLSRARSSHASPSVGLIKIYDKMKYSEMTGSANSGYHGIKKTDVFEHTYPHPPAVYGVLKSGAYHLPKGSVILKPASGHSVFKIYGSQKELSKSPVGKVLSKAGITKKSYGGK